MSEVKQPYVQITKLGNPDLDVITVYRSQEESLFTLKNYLHSLINTNKTTLIIGDFNFCYFKNRNEVSKYLEDTQFHQLINEATHIEGGTLDHAYYRIIGEQKEYPRTEVTSVYYSDHELHTHLIVGPKVIKWFLTMNFNIFIF